MSGPCSRTTVAAALLADCLASRIREIQLDISCNLGHSTLP